MFGAIDRRPWVLPLVLFGLTVLVGLILRFFDIFISFTNSPVRQQFYSSVTGSSSALLGFLIAAITILSTFGKRSSTTREEYQQEKKLAEARTGVIAVLLVSALLMLTTLVSATTALALSNSAGRLFYCDLIIVAAAGAGIVGIIYGSVALGLAVAERAR